MAVEDQSFELFAGNTAAIRFAITTDGTVAYDLSGVQDIIFTARLDPSSGVLFTKKKSVDGGIDFGPNGDGTDGICYVNFVASDTTGLSGFLYCQLDVVDVDGNIVTVAQATGKVGPQPAWSYSGDPASSDKDAIRYLVGDTSSTDPLVFDPEIAFALAERGSRYGAAALICRQLAARFAREASTSDGKMSTGLNQKSSAFSARAKEYEAQASEKSALVFVAGLPSGYLQ